MKRAFLKAWAFPIPMSETDNTGGTAPSEAIRESLWQRLRSRFGRSRDMGLRESLEGAIESHEAQNPGETVGEEAKSMMLNIIEFSGLRVDDVMVPRVDIVAVDEADSMQELLAKFIDANHSRMPVYRETLDGITGMIHVKDFLRWMAARGTPVVGVLDAGLMLTADGPKLIEYNVRFGDPECQVLMMRLESDIVPYFLACANGTLAEAPPMKWRAQAAICVVMAAKGYPEKPVTGTRIKGAEGPFGKGVMVFHAGTKRDSHGDLRAAGGRVLNVCATGRTLKEAHDAAYAAVARIDWPGGFYRRDIGWRALSR